MRAAFAPAPEAAEWAAAGHALARAQARLLRLAAAELEGAAAPDQAAVLLGELREVEGALALRPGRESGAAQDAEAAETAVLCRLEELRRRVVRAQAERCLAAALACADVDEGNARAAFLLQRQIEALLRQERR
ncbi:MAG: hypothetical protein HY812_10885, partial [Planctomycetes bacterium]|nr:hypothetical protein [Planctomycetota bacterium]